MSSSRPSRASKQRKQQDFDLLDRYLGTRSLCATSKVISNQPMYEFKDPGHPSNNDQILYLKTIYDMNALYVPKMRLFCLETEWYGVPVGHYNGQQEHRSQTENVSTYRTIIMHRDRNRNGIMISSSDWDLVQLVGTLGIIRCGEEVGVFVGMLGIESLRSSVGCGVGFAVTTMHSDIHRNRYIDIG